MLAVTAERVAAAKVVPAAVVGHSVVPTLLVKIVPFSVSVSPVVIKAWSFNLLTMEAVSTQPMMADRVSEVVKVYAAESCWDTKRTRRTFAVVEIVSATPLVAAAPPVAVPNN